MPTAIDITRSLAARPGLRAVSGFASVGAAGIAVNQVVLTVVVHTRLTGYLLAAILATQAAILFNFALLERWVFARGRTAEIGGRLARYWAISNAFLALGLPVLAVLVSGLHVHYALANLVVIGAQFAMRFVVSHRLIWSAPELVELTAPPTATAA